MRVHTADFTALSVLALALAACGRSSSAITEAGDPTAIATPSASATPTLTVAAPGVVSTPAAIAATTVASPTPTQTPEPAPAPRPDPEVVYFERAWQHRVDAAFTGEACPDVPELTYADGSYRGKLIDTHMHMPQLPDTPLGFEDGERDIEGFAESNYSNRDDFDAPVEGPFPFADQIPVAGSNITMSDVACTLLADGTAGDSPSSRRSRPSRIRRLR